MTRQKIGKFMASGVAIMLLTSGCSLPGKLGIGSSSSAQPGVKSAAKSAEKTNKAMQKGQFSEAIVFGEEAVAADPQNFEMRSLLGNAYMADGRFISAQQAFDDAMTLGDTNPRSVISLALAYTAQSKTNEARRLLSAHRTELPAADYGLALALNGDHDLAINVLVDAIQHGEQNARTRQNLAFAYAMAGRWQDAHMMAQQDLTPQAAQSRMVDWAQMSRPGAYDMRVASILGVSAKNDAGMPAMLVLNAADSDALYAEAVAKEANAAVPALPSSPGFYGTASLAAIGPAPKAGGADNFKAVVPAPTPVPAMMEPMPAMIAVPAPAAPVVAASAKPKSLAPIVEKRDAAPKRASNISLPKPIASAPMPAARKSALAAPKAALKPAKVSGTGGQYTVQLGAYSSANNATKAWNQHQKTYGNLKSLKSVHSSAKVNGKMVYRLSATGFINKKSAQDACFAIKAKGGDCIIRRSDGLK